MQLLSLLALVALPFAMVAADDTTSVSTYTSTRTVYRVYTETKSGSPTGTARAATTTGAASAKSTGSVIGAGSNLQANGIAVAAIGAAAAMFAL
jgi:hypothetical protein